MPDYTTSKESLNRFLTTITAELESLKRFMALYAPTLAPEFNAVDCLYPDENRLSAVIAMLLDPKGGHGQGAVFFKHFLSVLTEGIEENGKVWGKLKQIKNMNDEELQKARTEPGLEVATSLIADSQRRIDILLHFNISEHNRFGIAIENKPWAIDQPRQIEAYCKYLTKRYPPTTSIEDQIDYFNFILIYLSGNGQPPSEESVYDFCKAEMEKSGRFIVMSYSQLKKWCELCAEKCQSHRLRYFLEDFAIYIRDKFEGGIPLMEEEVVIKNALKPENISAAVAVGFSWPKIADNLFNTLVNLVAASLDLNSEEWKIDDGSILCKESGFIVSKKGWNDYRIRFDFEQKNTAGFCYGIQILADLPEKDRLKLYKYLESSALGKGKSSPTWPWYQHFEAPYRDWSDSDVPWVEIKKGGSTVDSVAVKLKKLIDVCNEYEKILNNTTI